MTSPTDPRKALEIRNTGPIESLDVCAPDGGGLVVLRGRNGSGKTTALHAVQALMGGGASGLESRDGQVRGHVEGWGAALVLGRRNSRAGELVVESIEGRLNIGDLVAPPIKDDASADRKRIQALVSLSNVEPTREMFASVLGEAVEAVDPDSWSGSDLLVVAGRVKRDIEGAAREAESESEQLYDKASAAMIAAEGLDIGQPHDADALRESYVKAREEFRLLERRREEHEKAQREIEAARERLKRLDEDYTGPTVAEAHEEEKAAEDAVEKASVRVLDLEQELAEAKEEQAQAIHNRDRAKERRESARSYASAREEAEQVLRVNAAGECPGPSEVESAREKVEEAEKAMETGTLIRQAIVKLEEAEGIREKAIAEEKSAEQLREAAAKVDEVLSRAIETNHLWVRDGRLYCEHPDRGETLFCELSDGERWEIAFDVAAPLLAEHGVLVLPQDAYQHLDPESREHVDQLARERQVLVLTAEATEGTLRAELFSSETQKEDS